MMRKMLSAAAVLAALAQPAHGQGFLDRLADRAIRKAQDAAEQVAEQAVGGDGGTTQTASATRSTQGAGSPPPAVMTPRAVSGGAPRAIAAPVADAAVAPARYTDDLPVPPEAEAQRQAYNAFGEVSCNDCEGGIDFDGRPKFQYDEFSGQYEERARRAGSWAVGHVHRWQGKESVGTITVLAEETFDGFRCRRLEYKLVKGGTSVARPSLICFGLASRESSVENWHEIY